MRIEHVALNVRQPVAMAEWYVKHLGLRVARQAGTAFFLADDGGKTVLEIYGNPAAPVPDYAAADVLVFHIAYVSTDVAADIERLVAAGATRQTPAAATGTGDVIGVVRDPWGVPVQLVKRVKPFV